MSYFLGDIMSTSLSPVSLPANTWVDLYVSTGISVGAQLIIQNRRTDDVFLSESATEPSGLVNNLGGNKLVGKEFITNISGNEGAWAYSEKGGSLQVEEASSFTPYTGDPTDASQELQKTAFGELSVAEPTPVIQVSAQYGLTDEIMTIATGSGSTYNDNSLFNVSTGVNPESIASLNTTRQLAYKPGQGALARFTAMYTQGATDSLQAAGLINSEDSFAFGFVDEDFGIIYSRNGSVEHQELTVTTGATGSENATITVNGINYTVPLTTGGLNHNAQEIASSLSDQVANFLFSANNNVVSSIDQLPSVGLSYAFSSATAVATWVQKKAGAAPIFNLIPQTTWNRNQVSWLDPTKGNVYSIAIQYLGFGNISFYIEDEASGAPILVHMIEYSNKNTTPSVSNPTFRIGWLVRNTGNTTDIIVSGASAAGFIEGKNNIDTIPRAVESVTTAIGITQTNIITVRNRFHFGDKINRADIVPLLISMGTEGAKGAFFRLIANPEFTGDINFNYINEQSSVAEYSTDQVALVPDTGRFIASFLVTEQGQVIGSSDFATRIFPDDWLTLSAAVTANPAAVMTASAVWQEDT